MGAGGIPCRLRPLLHLAAVLLVLLAPRPATCADLYAVVYKGCANQTFPGGAPPPTVAALSSALAAQSASAKFYKTSSASASSASASVFGLFQCRGDLSGPDCSSCVARAMSSWRDLCGGAVAARVQLNGCLALYEISGFPQVSGVQMLFKTCGSGGGEAAQDFETRRGTAFAQLEGGAGSSAGGFFATSFQQVYALAQCEGDLSNVDCSNCVTQAVQRVAVECGGAPSGQVYLDKCYITYSYYPHGVPHGGGGGLGGQQTAKTVAIVLGGALALGFLVICLLFARSLVKKKDGE
ncbi:plasmodesmata-located protein 2-like isoform X2 [Triticum urartu]|uniref:plasmodesmata-located protein 2-like isoform X2 n=1 Tax=Triticum dicoccoides TaxID=85692 RepID=UPI00188FBF2B|nr:plasmodesmata-located protein 2-like isoform X2 [Triticum dicoccoides]XP_044384032.1 plasmodesmata-located protein 2-like isoform X2 [Triticum aestivum]XP_048532721.1 plasmodesmata-located protein 2-like isoform X2 [Triticum urartu]